MGQKVHPTGMRLGIVKDWNAKWFEGKKKFAKTLVSDLKLKAFLKKELKHASVSKLVTERSGGNNIRVIIHTARPGVVIGKKGDDLEKLRKQAEKLTGSTVHLSVEEIRKPDLDATLVAENVAQQLERRVMFRRAMKRAVANALRGGAGGVRISVSGRLGGAEIARTEWYREGRVPLHTLRADIDYGVAEASTTYGIIGVKVWIFKGEVLGEDVAESRPDSVAKAA